MKRLAGFAAALALALALAIAALQTPRPLGPDAAPAAFSVREGLQPGAWKSAFDGQVANVAAGATLDATVPAHGVAVYTLDASVTDTTLKAEVDRAMARARRHVE